MHNTRNVVPLESDPEIFSSLSYKLGLSPILAYHDVFSITEPDLLALIPQPVYAVIMLFPLGKNYESYRKQTDENKEYNNNNLANVKWYKQTLGNGCGFYAILHAISNILDDFIIQDLILRRNLLSYLKSGISVDEISKLVENLEENVDLGSNYSHGQTQAPSSDDDIYIHFVTFIKGKDNHLYELDGRRKGPIDLGNSTPTDNILDDPHLKEKVQFYMDNAEEENKHQFALLALGPTQD